MNQLRLVGITRLSTATQLSGHGRQRQEELEIRAHADEIGADIVDIWEVQERATIFDRPQFEARLAAAHALREQGCIDGIIMASVDRLSRDPFDGGAVCREALRAGLKLFFAAERLDATKEDDQERIIGALLAARAYASRLKRQTGPARRARASAGKLPNGQVRWPFTYDAATGRATPNPVRSRYVRKWVMMLLDEGKSLRAIGSFMEEQHIPAPKGGSRWGQSTITRILGDPALKGAFHHSYERMESPSFWERPRRMPAQPELVYTDTEHAILDSGTWERVQAKLASNKDLARRNTRRDYGALQGMVSCDCGRKVGFYTIKGAAYVRCNTCRKGSALVARLWALVTLWLDEHVLMSDSFATSLLEQLTDPDAQARLASDIVSIKKELGEIDASREKALRAYVLLPNFPESKLEALDQDLSRRRADREQELSQKLSALNSLASVHLDAEELGARVNAFRERFAAGHEMSDSDRRQLLLDLGVKVVIEAADRSHLRVAVDVGSLGSGEVNLVRHGRQVHVSTKPGIEFQPS